MTKTFCNTTKSHVDTKQKFYNVSTDTFSHHIIKALTRTHVKVLSESVK